MNNARNENAPQLVATAGTQTTMTVIQGQCSIFNPEVQAPRKGSSQRQVIPVDFPDAPYFERFYIADRPDVVFLNRFGLGEKIIVILQPTPAAEVTS